MSRMIEEIREQPAALERTLAGGLRRAEAFRRIVARRRPRLIVLAARGTSDNAALFGRYLLEITTRIPVSLAAPSILTLYGARVDYRDALVVAISQSGESTDTNFLLERARAQGALTLGITNERSSSLARLAEHVFLVRAGKEKSVAATKTYTGQILLLYLLAWSLGGAIRATDLERLPGLVESALGLEAEVRECRRDIGVGLRDVLGVMRARVRDDQVEGDREQILVGRVSQDVGDWVRGFFASLDDADKR